MSNLVTLVAGTTPIEGGLVGTYWVTLNTPAPVGGLTVNFNTLASTATLNSDYNFALGANLTAITGNSFTIVEGATSATLNLAAHADAVADHNETVLVSLTAGIGYQFALGAFSPKIDYATASSPRSVSIGDFNNDGRIDLAVTSYISNDGSVLVLSRDAANTGFYDKVSYVTGSLPISVSSGDFNNDSKLDLAVANQDGTVSILQRNADNTGFDTKVDYAVGINLSSISTGDFNNDGKLDLAVTNNFVGSYVVSILLRNADNTGFDTKVDYAVGTSPTSVGAGDFNNDGKLDLAVANGYVGSDTISVLLRNTDNTGFDAKVDYIVGLAPSSVSVGDFNNDGKLDLVVTNALSNTISVLLRNADNTGFETKIDYATGIDPSSVSIGDFNNDGKLDLAVANFGSNTVSVLLRNADNTGFDAKVDYATGSGPTLVNVGDFNNDHKLDLVVANINSNAVSVLLNNSNPTATLIIADLLNDNTPVLATPVAINYTDTALIDTFATVTGSLVASDVDPSTTLTYGIVGGTTYADVIDMTSSYGRLTVIKATGAYSFYPNSEAMNALSVDTTSTFTVTVSDGQLTDTKTLAINITQSGVTESIGSDKLIGTTGNDVFNGLAGNDTINGLAGNDTINGGEGADKMLGGKGDDTYYVDNVNDKIVELARQGIDTVHSNVHYTLPDNVENLIQVCIDGYHPIGIGNELDNTLTTDAAHAGGTLYGLEGDDTLISYHSKSGYNTLVGGVGNDSYYVNGYRMIFDVIIEYTGEGEDTVYLSSDSYTLGDSVENLVVVSGGAAWESGLIPAIGTGNALDNHLTSNLANTRLEGLAGNDNYYVGNEGTVIVEAANQGWDTVLSTTNRTLETNVEELYLLGTDNLYGYGNDQDNNLNGNAGNNILDGRAGSDFMAGRAGDDEYYVDNTGDVVKEQANEGRDTVFSSLASYKLTANVENLVLIGTADINGTGNNLNNILGGNDANNILKGGAGDDYLQGINGADTFIAGLGKDINQLFETIATTDTVRIATGDSLIDSYDQASSFQLGTGTVSTAGVDKLDLDSTNIAANTAGVNGVDAGVIHSHSISSGIISFDDINTFTAPLAITADNLANVFTYLQANIIGGNTVAFVSGADTYVFQEGGVNDTLVELVSVIAHSVNTSGLGAGAVWIA